MKENEATICYLSEELRGVARTLKTKNYNHPELAKQLIVLAHTIQKQGKSMEKRLKVYRRGLENLGFMRIEAN